MSVSKCIKKIRARKNRVRARLRRSNSSRPRLSVYRTKKNIYAQLIDDVSNKTLASASTVEHQVRVNLKSGGNIDAAVSIGHLIVLRAKKLGVKKIIFDRGSYLYHGRVKALAESARKSGFLF